MGLSCRFFPFPSNEHFSVQWRSGILDYLDSILDQKVWRFELRSRFLQDCQGQEVENITISLRHPHDSPNVCKLNPQFGVK